MTTIHLALSERAARAVLDRLTGNGGDADLCRLAARELTSQLTRTTPAPATTVAQSVGQQLAAAAALTIPRGELAAVLNQSADNPADPTHTPEEANPA